MLLPSEHGGHVLCIRAQTQNKLLQAAFVLFLIKHSWFTMGALLQRHCNSIVASDWTNYSIAGRTEWVVWYMPRPLGTVRTFCSSTAELFCHWLLTTVGASLSPEEGVHIYDTLSLWSSPVHPFTCVHLNQILKSESTFTTLFLQIRWSNWR